MLNKNILSVIFITAAFIFSTASFSPAANPDGDLRIEKIAAYNFVVDSNIDTPSGYGPSAAYLGAHICNDGADDLTEVIVNIGDYGAQTPGVYPVTTASGVPYTGNFSFTHEGSLSDATRYVGTIPAGECVTQYWLVSYPQVDINGDPVFGANTDLSDDLVIAYDIWASADDNGTDLAADASYTGTMRNEISASANKIYPNTSSKVPDEYLAIIESNLGWRATISSTEAGTAAMIEGIWYDMGNVNQGFDNDGDLVPDYNLWLQPIGDASRFDADCFRLVSVSGLLIVKLNDGTELLIPVEDQLYFENLPANNTGVVGLVYYEWIPIAGGCSAELTPYQEAASGSENEKFNADFGAFGATISSTDPSIENNKSASPAIAVPGGDLEYSLSATNTGSSSLGNMEFAVALVLADSIPAGTTYVAGSADLNNTLPAGMAADTLFSVDGGVTWTVDEPGDPATVTDVQWHMSASLDPGETVTVTFKVAVPVDTTEVSIDNCADAGFGTGDPFDESCLETLVAGNNDLSGTVFSDNGSGADFANGTQDAGEPGIDVITVTLYWDKNGDGVLDAGDTAIMTTESDTNGDYAFADIPDGNYLVVVDSSDTDLAAGTGLTTPGTIAVPLDPEGTDGNPVSGIDNDFGFAPPLSLEKSVSTPVYEGQEITYPIAVTNHLAGTGGGGGISGPEGLYWSNDIFLGGDIMTSPPDDGSSPTAVGNVQNAGALAIDEVNGVIYYVVDPQSLEADRIYSINLDGTNETLVHTHSNNLDQINYIEIDPATGDLYYTTTTSSSAGQVILVPGDGSPATALVSAALEPVKGVALDSAGQRLYYLDEDFGIRYVDLVDLSDNATNCTGGSGTGTFVDLEFDPAGYLYFGRAGLNTVIHRCELSTGSDSSLYIVTNTAEGNIAINPATNSLWWNSDNVGEVGVWVGSMDGTTAATFFSELGTIKNDVEYYSGISSSGGFDPTATMYNVVLEDTYDPAELEFVSASVTPDATAPAGTLTWDDIGPIEPGRTVTVNVTFRVLYGNAGLTIDNDAAVTSSEFIDGTPGNTPTGTAGFILQPAGSISGVIWSDSAAGTDGWFDPVLGYEPGVDFGVAGVTVNLWACQWNDDTDGEALNTPVDSGDASYEIGSDCDSQGSGPGRADWYLVATTTTDDTGAYSFDSIVDNGFYSVQTDPGTMPGTVTQTAEANDNQTPGGITCGACDDTWGDITQTLNATYFNELDVSASEDITDVNFGYTVPATLFGNLWEDLDGDGVQDAGDGPLSGWTIDVTGPACTTPPCTTTTDANGDYLITDLGAGAYTITVTTPAGQTWTQTVDPDGTLDSQTSGTLIGGEISGSHDFAYTYTGTSTIGDTVYYDFNGDGIQDAGDEGIAGVTVYLYEDEDGDGIIDTGVDALIAVTTTAADGTYSFTDLPAGDYTVVVDESSAALAGTTQTGDPDESGDTCSSCDADGSAAVDGTNLVDTVDFGYQPVGTGSIGDTVFIDANGDGSQSGGSETGIADITVELWADLNGDGTYGLVATAVTDADGNYLFDNLPAADYRIIVDDADTDLPTTGSGASYAPSTATSVDKTLADGEAWLDSDFGFGPLGSIGDTVYWDNNLNGTQDTGELGIAGVTVTLTPPAGVDLGSGAGVAITTVTDADGKYLFEDLPASNNNYTVTVTQPLNTLGATAAQTGDPQRDGSPCWDDTYLAVDLYCDNSNFVTVDVGTVDLGSDFGYQPSGIIGDTIWRDLNNDGIQDAGEVGIAGVTLTVTNGTDTYNVTTDTDGHYSVAGLGDGSWTVTVDASNFAVSGALEGYAATYDVDGGTDNTTTVVVTNGLVENTGNSWCAVAEECSLDLDFGYDMTGTNTLTGSICLDDASLDGVCSTGSESLLADQEVYLWDLGADGVPGGGDDTLLGSVVTDILGDYGFDNLPDGNYAVVIGTGSEPLSYSSLTTTVADTPATALSNNGTSVIQTVPVSGNVTGVDFAFDFDQPVDFGDLPSTYPTTLSDHGPAHILDTDPLLFLGVGVDDETDGQPDTGASLDTMENGIDFSAVNTWAEGAAGGSIDATIAGATADGKGWLVGWIDFNGDGDLTDPDEMIISQDVGSGTSSISFDVPAGTRLTGSFYVRFRLFENKPVVPELSYLGTVTDGEVEDYQLLFPLDYGDAPESYQTIYGAGPRHFIDSNLFMGTVPDREDDGAPVAAGADNTGANGDGIDEDGVVIGSLKTFYERFRLSYGASVEVAVTNNTAESAQLVCWVDWGQDGAFDTADRSEALIYGTGCLAGTGATDATFTTGNVAAGCSGTATVLWTGLASVPASGQVYSRCRITTDGSGTGTGFFSDSSPLPTGASSSGEVEDDLLNLNPTSVTIGKIGLRAYTPAVLLAELLGVESMSNAALMELLSVWDPDLADSLGAADSETLLAALRDYLDPDGDGRVAVLQWETTAERGTIGFYVERNDDGGQGAWHRINDDMLPGLITAPMGGYYWLADPEARSGVNYLYRMIEQEARGGQNTYGPYPLRLQ